MSKAAKELQEFIFLKLGHEDALCANMEGEYATVGEVITAIIDDRVKGLVEAAEYGLASSSVWETHAEEMREPIRGIRAVIEFTEKALAKWQTEA